MGAFEVVVGDGVALRLAEPRLAPQYHAMIERNRARLARWERWAETPSSEADTRAWLTMRMTEFAHGRQVPTVIVADGELVGSCAAEIDTYAGGASIGFWVDGASEGKGIVTAAARTLIRLVFDDYPVARFELRTAAGNVRSQAVARRLGFTLDGTLRSAAALGDGRVDQCVFTLLPGELA